MGLGDLVTSLNFEGDRESDRLMVLAIAVASTRWGCVGDGNVIVPPPPLEYDMVSEGGMQTALAYGRLEKISKYYRSCNIDVVSERLVRCMWYTASDLGGLKDGTLSSLLSSVANWVRIESRSQWFVTVARREEVCPRWKSWADESGGMMRRKSDLGGVAVTRLIMKSTSRDRGRNHTMTGRVVGVR